MATRRWRGAGDEGAAGVAAPAIALGAWILLTPAMFSGTVLAAFAGTNRGTRAADATVMRRAELRKVHALFERGGFPAMLAAPLMHGVPATGLHYVAGVAPVGVPAFPGRWRSAPWFGRHPMPCSAKGSAGVARHDPDRRSIDRGRRVTAAVLVRRLRTPVAAT